MSKSTLDQNDKSSAKEDLSPLAKYLHLLRPRDRAIAEGLNKSWLAAEDRDDEYRLEQVEDWMKLFMDRTGLLNFILGPKFRTM